jgi:hypothetical protein
MQMVDSRGAGTAEPASRHPNPAFGASGSFSISWKTVRTLYTGRADLFLMRACHSAAPSWRATQPETRLACSRRLRRCSSWFDRKARQATKIATTADTRLITFAAPMAESYGAVNKNSMQTLRPLPCHTHTAMNLTAQAMEGIQNETICSCTYRDRQLLLMRAESAIWDRFLGVAEHGIFTGDSPEGWRPSGDGTEVGPMPVLPDEPARLREDATLSLPDVHSTELHGAGGVEEPAVTRVQDDETGPLECRVQAEGLRTA